MLSQVAREHYTATQMPAIPRDTHRHVPRHGVTALIVLGTGLIWGGLACAAITAPGGSAQPPGQPSESYRIGHVASAIKRAQRLMKSGSCGAAHVLLETTLRAHPADARVYAELSEIALTAGHPRQALKYAQAAERRDPRSARYWRLLALQHTAVLQHAGFFARIWGLHRIKYALSRAVALDPHDSLALFYLQQMNAHTPEILGGDAAAAHSEFATLQHLNPSAALASLAMDAALLKHWTQADEEVDRAIDNSPSRTTDLASLMVAGLMLNDHRYRSARTVLVGLIAHDPNVPGARSELAVDDLRAQAHLHEALKYLRQDLAAPAAACTSAPSRAEEHYRLGRLYSLMHKPVKAATQYRTALALDARLPMARHALAQLRQ